MPELDGASATRMIRAGGPAEAPVLDRDLMIIALTANASEEDRARYLACGMDDFLTKPIDEAALHAAAEPRHRAPAARAASRWRRCRRPAPRACPAPPNSMRCSAC